MQRFHLCVLSSNQALSYPHSTSRVSLSADAFILVFDDSSLSCLERIKLIYRQLRKIRKKRPLILVGRCEGEDVVQPTTDTGFRLAEKWKCDFAQIEGENGGDVEDLFVYLGILGNQIGESQQAYEREQARRASSGHSAAIRPNFARSRHKIHSAIDQLWNEFLYWLLGYDPRLRFEPVPGLETFQSPPIAGVSTLTLSQKWMGSGSRAQSSRDTTLRDSE